MKRGAPWKAADPDSWLGRRRKARAFLKAAKDLLALLEPDGVADPILSDALLSVIAYADALTIRFAGIRNSQEHTGVTRALRHALGERADAAQLQRVERMIGLKNEIQYDHRTADVKEARRFIEQAERFAQWAEQELLRP
jgi:uncharacterized protein (UPF0332 family)